MQHQYQLHYTPKILRAAAVTFFKQLIGPTFPLLLIALASYVLWQFTIGNRSWLVGATAGAILVVVSIMLSLFIGHLKHASKTAAELDKSPTTLTISEVDICFKSSLGTAEIPWSNVKALHHEKEFLLLQFKRGSYTSIPTSSLDDTGVSFIKSTVMNNGGKVT
jgi:uncharacterized membrane protein